TVATTAANMDTARAPNMAKPDMAKMNAETDVSSVGCLSGIKKKKMMENIHDSTKPHAATYTLTISARYASLSNAVSWKVREALERASIPPSRFFESSAIVRVAMAHNQRGEQATIPVDQMTEARAYERKRSMRLAADAVSGGNAVGVDAGLWAP